MTTAVVYSFLGDDTSKYWFTKNTFLISVAVLLTAILLWIWFYKREELKKDAKIGAVGYFVVIMALIVLHYSTGDKLFQIGRAQVRTPVTSASRMPSSA